MMKQQSKIIEMSMEAAYVYEIKTHQDTFCVNELAINVRTFEDGSMDYSVETNTYTEVTKMNDDFQTVLDDLETYFNDDETHETKLVTVFDTFGEALDYANKEYPKISIEQELKKYY